MGLSNDYLSLLKARPQWEALTGEDSWGNNTYAAPVTMFAYEDTSTESAGATDDQGAQDAVSVTECQIVSDYYGVHVRDRITLTTGEVMYVTAVETGKGEKGEALFHTITARSAQRG